MKIITLKILYYIYKIYLLNFEIINVRLHFKIFQQLEVLKL